MIWPTKISFCLRSCNSLLVHSFGSSSPIKTLTCLQSFVFICALPYFPPLTVGSIPWSVRRRTISGSVPNLDKSSTISLLLILLRPGVQRNASILYSASLFSVLWHYRVSVPSYSLTLWMPLCCLSKCAHSSYIASWATSNMTVLLACIMVVYLFRGIIVPLPLLRSYTPIPASSPFLYPSVSRCLHCYSFGLCWSPRLPYWNDWSYTRKKKHGRGALSEGIATIFSDLSSIGQVPFTNSTPCTFSSSRLFWRPAHIRWSVRVRCPKCS